MTSYRMKDLVARTGMSRQAIHFYIKQGLVPPGEKRGATRAVYREAHVERILLVRRLRQEHFLPLDAIRAGIDRRDGAFSPAQRRVIRGVRQQLASRGGGARSGATLGLAATARRSGATVREIEALARAELVPLHAGPAGQRRVARDDLWIVEAWVELKRLGFSPARGFGPADLGIYWRAMEALVGEEVALVSARMAALPPADLVVLIERALPVLEPLLGRLHDRILRRFLDQRGP